MYIKYSINWQFSLISCSYERFVAFYSVQDDQKSILQLKYCHGSILHKAFVHLHNRRNSTIYCRLQESKRSNLRTHFYSILFMDVLLCNKQLYIIVKYLVELKMKSLKYYIDLLAIHPWLRECT